MSDIATRLRTFLLSDATIQNIVGENCHQGSVPQSIGNVPYIWFGRAGIEPLPILATGVVDPLLTRFDVEAISEDLETTESLGTAVRNKLDRYRGTFGDGTTQGIFVEDHNEDYTPRGVFSDEGAHVAAFSVEIF